MQSKGQDGTSPTVTVKGADGKPVRINKSDYDEEEHGAVLEDSEAPAKGARGKRAKAQDYDSLTKEELQEKLDKAGVDYTTADTKDELIKKLKKG